MQSLGDQETTLGFLFAAVRGPPCTPAAAASSPASCLACTGCTRPLRDSLQPRCHAWCVLSGRLTSASPQVGVGCLIGPLGANVLVKPECACLCSCLPWRPLRTAPGVQAAGCSCQLWWQHRCFMARAPAEAAAVLRSPVPLLAAICVALGMVTLPYIGFALAPLMLPILACACLRSAGSAIVWCASACRPCLPGPGRAGRRPRRAGCTARCCCRRRCPTRCWAGSWRSRCAASLRSLVLLVLQPGRCKGGSCMRHVPLRRLQRGKQPCAP